MSTTPGGVLACPKNQLCLHDLLMQQTHNRTLDKYADIKAAGS